MKKYALIIILSLFPCLAFANLGNSEQIQSDLKAETLAMPSIHLELTAESMLNIIELVNKNYINSLNLKHKDEAKVFAILSNFFDRLQKSIMTCNESDVYGDLNCVSTNLSDMRVELLEKAKITYSGFVGENTDKKHKVTTDFYAINYYYFMSKVYSECSIKDEENRLKCLGDIPFLEVELSTLGL